MSTIDCVVVVGLLLVVVVVSLKYPINSTHECTGGRNEFGPGGIKDKNCKAGSEIGVNVICNRPIGGTKKVCAAGDVKLEAMQPYTYFESKWYPICGHNFWDNNDGATTVCNKLGYARGIRKKTKTTFKVNAMQVGACKKDEPMNNCTGGRNEFGPGGIKDKNCKAGSKIGVNVIC